MDYLKYTEKQLKIINGETPMEEAGGKVISWLYKKAVANNDHELAKKAKVRLIKPNTLLYHKRWRTHLFLLIFHSFFLLRIDFCGASKSLV